MARLGEGVGAPLLVKVLDIFHDASEQSGEQDVGRGWGDGGPEAGEDAREEGDEVCHSGYVI